MKATIIANTQAIRLEKWYFWNICTSNRAPAARLPPQVCDQRAVRALGDWGCNRERGILALD